LLARFTLDIATAVGYKKAPLFLSTRGKEKEEKI